MNFLGLQIFKLATLLNSLDHYAKGTLSLKKLQQIIGIKL